MNLWGFYKDNLHLQKKTAVDTWTTAYAELPCRVERHQLDDEMFQRVEGESLSKASVPEQLDIHSNYRVCLSEDDDTDTESFKVVDNIQLVFDKSNRFIHTVIWF